MRPGQSPPERPGSIRNLPWSRIFLATAVIGPPLAIGGAPAEVIPAFILLVALVCHRLCVRSPQPLAVPWVAVLGALAVAMTLLQWLPLGLRGVLAPGLDAEIAAALASTDARAWPGLSPTPGDTALEVGRLVGLTLLCIAAAQLTWRTTALFVAVAGTLVAVIGFAHEIAGSDLIYGWYRPQETVVHAHGAALLGTFINPNHQSGLLLLGTFAAGGLAVDQHRLGHDTRDPAKADAHGDRFLAAFAALSIQLPALVLSMSRGALVSLLVLGPIALWLGLRSRRRSARRAERSRRRSPMRWVVLACMAAMLLVVARHGAWRELSTLAELFDPEAELEVKLRMIGDAPALLTLSPVLGLGPGAFVDLFATVDSQPGPTVFTHMESAPVAAILRWGPVVGSIVVLGLASWWIAAMRHVGRPRQTVARRIVLLGVLALGLQNLADFSLEFLGVAAPAAALLGALSPPRWLHWPAAAARKLVPMTSAAALLLAIVWVPSTWSHREKRNASMQAGELQPETLLRVRPLDGRLHGLLARRAAEAGDWTQARTRAETATRLRPGSIDAWLLRSAAEAQLGAHDEAVRSTRRALSLLRVRPSEPLVRWLLLHHPQPDDLVAVAPEDDLPWLRLVEGLMPIAAAHADTLAAARAQARPADPVPLRIRSQLALQARNPALALHHARLLHQLAPAELTSPMSVVAALRAFAPPRHEEARDVLEQALAQRWDDPEAEARISEELLRTLILIGDRDALVRAREISDMLLRRPVGRAQRLRWEALAAELEQAQTRLVEAAP